MRTSLGSRYGFVVLAVALASIVRFVLTPVLGEGVPFILYFPTVVVCAWFGGFGPGLVAAALGAFVAWLVFIPPRFSVAFSDPTAPGQLVVFLLSSALISLLAESLLRARRRVEAGERHEREQRERLRVTLASVGDAVIATDADGRITLMNAVAEVLTGWKEREASGRPVEEVFVIVNEPSGQPAEHPVGRVLRKGVITGLANHTVLISRSGRSIPIDDSAAPIRWEDGRIAGVVMVFRDVTERKRADGRQALQHEATQILAESAVFEVAAATIVRLIGERLGWDTSAVWIAGREADVLRCADVWHRPDVKVDAFEASTRALGFPRGVGLPGRVWATGQPVWLPNAADDLDFVRASDAVAESVHGAVFVPIVSRGHVIGVLEALSQQVQPFDPDVLVALSSIANRIGQSVERQSLDAARERLLERERAARQESETANRAKDEFLAMLSHELRTPLNTILGWARTLRAGELPRDKVDQALAAIERNARLQTRLIEDLLDVSRIVTGKLVLQPHAVELGAVAQAALDALRGSAEAAGVQLRIDIAPALPSLVGDAARLQQVVSNLLLNAIKFTERGGWVDVRVRRVEAAVELVVQDTGRGIQPDLLPHVFERFRQGEPAGVWSVGGLGVGLAIVRYLVERHGGTVEAESPGEGKGATFTVRLPLRQESG